MSHHSYYHEKRSILDDLPQEYAVNSFGNVFFYTFSSMFEWSESLGGLSRPASWHGSRRWFHTKAFGLVSYRGPKASVATVVIRSPDFHCAMSESIARRSRNSQTANMRMQAKKKAICKPKK